MPFAKPPPRGMCQKVLDPPLTKQVMYVLKLPQKCFFFSVWSGKNIHFFVLYYGFHLRPVHIKYLHHPPWNVCQKLVPLIEKSVKSCHPPQFSHSPESEIMDSPFDWKYIGGFSTDFFISSMSDNFCHPLYSLVWQLPLQLWMGESSRAVCLAKHHCDRYRDVTAVISAVVIKSIVLHNQIFNLKIQDHDWCFWHN